MQRNLISSAIASQWDRLTLDPGTRPSAPPCARCAIQRHTDADVIADLRRQVEDAEVLALHLRQEIARLNEEPA
jgi:hypothetical protein